VAQFLDEQLYDHSKPFLLGVVTDQDEGGKETANNDPQVPVRVQCVRILRGKCVYRVIKAFSRLSCKAKTVSLSK
jgi:hypothetical protein